MSWGTVNIGSVSGIALRPTLKSSFVVESGAEDTSKSMSVDMSALRSAEIDIILLHGTGVTVTIGDVEVLDTLAWGSVLDALDEIRLTATLQCKNGIYIKDLYAAPIDISAPVLPMVASGYLPDSTDNNVSVTVTITAASGSLEAGCEGEIWGR